MLRTLVAASLIASAPAIADTKRAKCRAMDATDAKKMLGEAEGENAKSCAFSLDVKLLGTVCVAGTLGKTFEYRVDFDHVDDAGKPIPPKASKLTCKREVKPPAPTPDGPELACRILDLDTKKAILDATGRTPKECYPRLLDKIKAHYCVAGSQGKRFEFLIENDHPVSVAGRPAKPLPPRKSSTVCVYEKK